MKLKKLKHQTYLVNDQDEYKEAIMDYLLLDTYHNIEDYICGKPQEYPSVIEFRGVDCECDYYDCYSTLTAITLHEYIKQYTDILLKLKSLK